MGLSSSAYQTKLALLGGLGGRSWDLEDVVKGGNEVTAWGYIHSDLWPQVGHKNGWIKVG